MFSRNYEEANVATEGRRGSVVGDEVVGMSSTLPLPFLPSSELDFAKASILMSCSYIPFFFFENRPAP